MYRTSRYIPYRLVHQYKYPPCFVLEKILAIPAKSSYFSQLVDTEPVPFLTPH